MALDCGALGAQHAIAADVLALDLHNVQQTLQHRHNFYSRTERDP